MQSGIYDTFQKVVKTNEQFDDTPQKIALQTARIKRAEVMVEIIIEKNEGNHALLESIKTITKWITFNRKESASTK